MKMYEISEKQIEKITDVLYYFQHHNKNLTKAQESMIDQLEEVADKLYDIFSGYADDPYEEISYPEILEVIRTLKPYGKFIAQVDVDLWIAIDNWNGDASCRWFKTKRDAIDWLSDY